MAKVTIPIDVVPIDPVPTPIPTVPDNDVRAVDFETYTFPDTTLGENEDGVIVEFPAISPFYYVRVSDAYANAYFKVKESLHNIRLALIKIVSLDPEVEVDLLPNTAFMKEKGTLLIFANNVAPAIRTLHAHITRRGRYGNINEYLDEQEITVSRHWADLCEVAGTPIEEQYIH